MTRREFEEAESREFEEASRRYVEEATAYHEAKRNRGKDDQTDVS
jgi:hypothetical protein